MSSDVKNMAQTIFHFLFFKICNKKLRYIIIGPSEDLKVSTPLFLGIDLLHQTGIAKNNYCRIHVRYAKKGLATKVMFPNDVNIAGIHNCQSGAWFYSLQGVFQLIFEYQSRKVQLKIAAVLFVQNEEKLECVLETRRVAQSLQHIFHDLWKSDHASPNLSETLNVSLEQLQSGCNSSFLSQLLESCHVINQQQQHEQQQQHQVEETLLQSCEGDENIEMEDDTAEVASLTVTADSLWCLCGEMIRRVEAYASRCRVDECHLVVGVVATLKLVRTASKSAIKDSTFVSFMEMIASYESITSDVTTLKRFGATPWCVDSRQDALLCLVGEWFGKYMNIFNKAIAEKVDRFKLEHLGSFEDLPTSETLFGELFPECMRLLVGHWSGLYRNVTVSDVNSGTFTAEDDVQIAAHKGKFGNREDHSYSTSKEDPTVGGDTGTTRNVQTFTSNNNNRVDHSYSSSSPTGNSIETQHVVERKDHTYVAQHETGELSPSSSLQTTRKDHTYVSTKDKRTRVSSNVPLDTGQVLNPSKRIRIESNATIWSGDSNFVVVDPAKYSVVQLTLEFLNNVLVSGVAHVVYTRLLHT